MSMRTVISRQRIFSTCMIICTKDIFFFFNFVTSSIDGKETRRK